ncbi:hypothetical protein ACW4DH_16355 [Halomonas sp. WWR20]
MSATVMVALAAAGSAIAEQDGKQRLDDPHQEKFHDENQRGDTHVPTVRDQQDNEYRRGYGNQDVISEQNSGASQNGGDDQGAEEANQGGTGGPQSSQGG